MIILFWGLLFLIAKFNPPPVDDFYSNNWQYKQSIYNSETVKLARSLCIICHLTAIIISFLGLLGSYKSESLFMLVFFIPISYAISSSIAPGIILHFAPKPKTICVARGTMILTPSGLEPIEDIILGSEVLSQNNEGKIQTARVSWKGQFETKDYLKFSFSDGRILECTPTHLIATAFGWVKAGDLRNGGWVLTRTGLLQINKIKKLSNTQTIYDMDIELSHTYFANGVLVHNKSMNEIPPDNLHTDIR